MTTPVQPTVAVESITSCSFEKATPNVRTVLFEKHDLSKSCWAVEDIGLLFNRYIFQSLLPLKPPSDIKAFLEYVLSCLDLLNDEVASKNAKRVLIHALADNFGGYLQALAVPISNELFYEGNLDVKTAVDLHVLQNDMKYTLKSDGSNWAPSTLIKGPIRPIEPLTINSGDFKETCKASGCCDLIIFDKKSCGAVVSKKTTNSFESNLYDDATEKNNVKVNATLADIPIPFFDDCKHPHAIAVPLKDNSLYSLTSNASYGILTKYYKISIYCINEKCETMANARHTCKRSLKEFNLNLYIWMIRNVLPLLQKSRAWFPAFYEVLRVFKAIDQSVNNCTQDHLLVIEENQTKEYTGIRMMLHNLRYACPCLLTLVILLCLLVFFCKFCYISVKRSGDEDFCENEKEDPSIGAKLMRGICPEKRLETGKPEVYKPDEQPPAKSSRENLTRKHRDALVPPKRRSSDAQKKQCPDSPTPRSPDSPTPRSPDSPKDFPDSPKTSPINTIKVRRLDDDEADEEAMNSPVENAESSRSSKYRIDSSRTSNATYDKNAALTYFMGLEGTNFPDLEPMHYKEGVVNEKPKKKHKKAFDYMYDESSYVSTTPTTNSTLSVDSAPFVKETNKATLYSQKPSTGEYQLENHKHIKGMKLKSVQKRQRKSADP